MDFILLDSCEWIPSHSPVAKIRFALSAPVPWAIEEVRSEPTVHLVGSRVEFARGEAQAAAGMVPGSLYAPYPSQQVATAQELRLETVTSSCNSPIRGQAWVVATAFSLIGPRNHRATALRSGTTSPLTRRTDARHHA